MRLSIAFARSIFIAIPNERQVKSFADDLITKRGVVSGRVTLLLRSTETQPLLLDLEKQISSPPKRSRVTHRNASHPWDPPRPTPRARGTPRARPPAPDHHIHRQPAWYQAPLVPATPGTRCWYYQRYLAPGSTRCQQPPEMKGRH